MYYVMLIYIQLLHMNIFFIFMLYEYNIFIEHLYSLTIYFVYIPIYMSEKYTCHSA